jgi:hypothetical protein
MCELIIREIDMKEVYVLDDYKAAQHTNGFYNATALCLDKKVNISDFFNVRRIIKTLDKIGGISEHRQRWIYNGKYVTLISGTLLPHLMQWLDPDFDHALYTWKAEKDKELAETNCIIAEQTKRLRLCRQVNIETVDDLNASLAENRELAIQLNQMTDLYYKKRSDFNDLLEERDELVETLNAIKDGSNSDDVTKQYNKEVQDIIRDKTAKKKRLLEQEDLELEECLLAKKKKFEQLVLNKVLYKN